MRLPRFTPAFLRDARGMTAVEFALTAPVFIACMVGVADFGGMIAAKLDLNNSVSAGANFVQVKSTDISSANGASLASNTARIVANMRAANYASSSIVVNNGPTASMTNGSLSSGGSASAADACYCPTQTGGAVTWGAAQSCGSARTGGGIAGKFVAITATRTYTPIFFSFFRGTMSELALVQAS